MSSASGWRGLGFCVGLGLLLLLPGLSGCGCSTDEGFDDLGSGGGARCQICVAFRVLERDLPIDPMVIAQGVGGGMTPTVDVKLCPVVSDVSLGTIEVTPACVQGLAVGEVAEFTIEVDEPHLAGAQACFRVCNCTTERQLDYFCIEWRSTDCSDWEIVSRSPNLEAPDSQPPSGELGRVVRCDQMADLCCFCVTFQCTEGFTQPPPIESPASLETLVGGGGTATSESPKEVCIGFASVDLSFVDQTLGYEPLAMPACQTVSTEGGIAVFRVCVLDTFTSGSSFKIGFFNDAQEQIGTALVEVTRGEGGECEPGIVEGDPTIRVDADCEPVVQPCCVPITFCFAAVDSELSDGTAALVEVQQGTNIAGWSVFQESIPLPPQGAAVTFWVCVPEDHGDGTVVLQLSISSNVMGEGGVVGIITLTYDASEPCKPSVEFAGEGAVPWTVGTSITCPEQQDD